MEGAANNRQTTRERRDIRKQYRDLMIETKDKKEEMLVPDTGTELLHDTLLRTNEIYKKVTMPREAVLDGQLIAVIAQMGKQQAQQLQTEFVTFQPVEFAEKLMTYLDVPRFNEDRDASAFSGDVWARLGRGVGPSFKRTPTINYMFGAFERGPPKEKIKIERRKKEKETTAKTAVVPKQVLDIKDQEKREATTEEVEHVLAILRMFYNKWNKQPLCFFEFVVDPTSFGKTIENIFYTSFLVRDGHVKVYLDDDRLPVIEPVSQKKGSQESDVEERHQVVVSITQSEWEEIIETFQIKKALIPTQKRKSAT